MVRNDDKVTVSEQDDLFELEPKNAKKISLAAKRFVALKAEAKISKLALDDACERLLRLCHESGVQFSPDGSARFRANGTTIEISPTKERIKVRFIDDGNEEESE